jgi:eukaryotic-like serine/threonine-protein kinase
VPSVINPDQLTFEQCALASGLLTPQQLDEARAGVRWSEGDEPDANAPPSDKQIADRLVDMGLLNRWQVKQLFDGRTKFNLGPYLIIDSIGKGGMGQVFKAQHSTIERIVAVKVLPRDKSTPEAIDSFTREIRALTSLNHPKLVAAIDDGQDGNVYYLVTEYVPGLDLRKLVRRDGPLSMAAAASVMCQVAEALEYAHAQGVVHRDVKPGNVLVSPTGEAKLSDLGLAGSLGGDAATDPRHGKILGTADYLSPDHVRDPWNPAPAWDIYSLGCTLYYAVTGKVPFPGGTTSDKARAHCDLRPLDPRRLNPLLTAEFVDVMADMMAKEPSHRISSARQVIERMTPFLSGLQESPPSIVPPPVSVPLASQRVIPLTMPPPLTTVRPPMPVGALADTRTDLSSVASGASQQVFEPVQPDDEDSSVSLEIAIAPPRDIMSVLWPLTIYVLAPLALIGTIVLLLLLVWAVI